MTKAPTPIQHPKGKVTTQKRHQNFDYTTIADRLRTVSLGNDTRVFFQFVRNGAGSLAIWKIAQFWYSLGKVKNNMNLINEGNLHIISILFRLLLTTLYYPFLDLVFWNLCTAHSLFVLKPFTLRVCSKLGIFGPLFGKKDTIWHWDWVLITDIK